MCPLQLRRHHSKKPTQHAMRRQVTVLCAGHPNPVSLVTCLLVFHVDHEIPNVRLSMASFHCRICQAHIHANVVGLE